MHIIYYYSMHTLASSRSVLILHYLYVHTHKNIVCYSERRMLLPAALGGALNFASGSLIFGTS